MSRQAITGRAACALTLLLLLGCAARPPAPRLPATIPADADLYMLSGNWEGTYTGDADGRSGRLVILNLRGSRASASGLAMLMPPADCRPVLRADSGVTVADSGAACHALTVHFTRDARGRLEGKISPYRAPDGGGELRTTLLGGLRGDELMGTFRTAGKSAVFPASGTWRARKAP